MNCPECGSKFVSCEAWTRTTLVGYTSPPGHSHDGNCHTKWFKCEQGHDTKLSIKTKCPSPGCDWKPKDTCYCHFGPKLDAWPDVPSLMPEWLKARLEARSDLVIPKQPVEADSAGDVPTVGHTPRLTD